MNVNGVKPLPSVERLRELLSYCPETGEIRNRVKRGNRAMPGRLTGTVNLKATHPYLVLAIDKCLYKAHRIIWALHHGEDPGAALLDHINGDTLDNRISNLRRVLPSQNSINIKARANISGERNVQPRLGGWCVRLTRNGKRMTVGTFRTKDEAAEAYRRASAIVYGEFARAE